MGQLVPAEGMIRCGQPGLSVRDIITWDTEHFRGDIMRLLKSIALTRVPATSTSAPPRRITVGISLANRSKTDKNKPK